jgi:hypothetical protein
MGRKELLCPLQRRSSVQSPGVQSISPLSIYFRPSLCEVLFRMDLLLDRQYSVHRLVPLLKASFEMVRKDFTARK